VIDVDAFTTDVGIVVDIDDDIRCCWCLMTIAGVDIVDYFVMMTRNDG